MALGFTSHYTKQDQPFGSLILSNSETETSGSVASNSNDSYGVGLLYSGSGYDSCEFSVSVSIDYSQYANFVSSSGSTETAGSVACSGGGFSTASTVSFSAGGGCSSSCGSSASFTC